jgi:hypothetical protein
VQDEVLHKEGAFRFAEGLQAFETKASFHSI